MREKPSDRLLLPCVASHFFFLALPASLALLALLALFALLADTEGWFVREEPSVRPVAAMRGVPLFLSQSFNPGQGCL